MVGQNIRSIGRGRFEVQINRSGDTISLNQQQLRNFQQGLSSSFQSGKLKRLGEDSSVQKAVDFGFSEGQRLSAVNLRTLLEAGAGQSLDLGDRLTREAFKSVQERQFREKLGRDIRSGTRGRAAEVISRRTTPTATERALQQSLPRDLRNLGISQLPTRSEIRANQTLLNATPNQNAIITGLVSREINQLKNTTDKKGVQERISDKLKNLGLTDTNIKTFVEKLFKPIPSVENLDKKDKFTPFAEKTGLADFERGLEPTQFKEQEFAKGVIEGNVKGLRDEPVKTGLTLAAFLALPTALRGVAAVGKATKVTPFISSITPQAVKTVGKFALTKGLLAAYVGSTGLEIAQEPTPRAKGELTGRVISTEIVPFSLGSRIGVKGDLKLQLKNELKTELKNLPANRRAAFEEYMKQSEVLGRYQPKVTNVKFNEVESIPNNAIPTIRKFFKENNIAIGGSAAQTAQLPLGRKAGDIDAYVPTGLDPKQTLKKLVAQLEKAGIKRVGVGGGGRVLTIEGKKAIDFNNIERLLSNITQVTPFYVPARSYLVKTPEGITIQRVSVQLRRKAVAGFVDPKRRATGKYKKDLQDFKSIADKLFKRAEINARQSFFFKNKKIRELERTFGVKLERQPFSAKFIKSKDVIKKPSKLTAKLGVKAGEGKGKTPKTSKIKLKDKTGKFKEPAIRTRAKLKGSQPFGQSVRKLGGPLKSSQTSFKKPKKLIAPSQQSKKPFFPSQPPKRPTPSQPPFTPSQPPARPPFKPPIIPSQPPARPPFKPPIIPSQPPARPPRLPLIPRKRRLIEQLKRKMGAKSFDVEVRRRMKFRTIATRQGFNRAIKKGSDRVSKNLSATFRLTPNQRKPLKKDIPKVDLDPQVFRRPVPKSPLRKPLTFIEKKNKRLEKRGQSNEVKQIQVARKRNMNKLDKRTQSKKKRKRLIL